MSNPDEKNIAGLPRKLVAILFADVTGYSRMMHKDEDHALQILDRFQEVLEEEVLRAGGRIVKKYGDGSLCLFDSAVQAVSCSKKAQLRFRESPQVPIRIGLHTGDIVEKDNDIFGDGVNIAARLESMGKPGTVLFSKSIYDKVRNHREFEIAPLGSFRLKNIDDPVEVFALSNEGFTVPKLSELKTPSSAPVKKTRNKWVSRALILAILVIAFAGMKWWNDFSQNRGGIEQSIAVLPFQNESDDASNEYFCNGMMEDILTQLQKIDEFKVISRTSVMHYKDSPKPIRTIADELDVAYVLRGSVRKSGNQILVTTQLVEAQDESQVWAGRYDEQLTAQNIFDIQSTIADNIAARLEAEISPTEQRLMDEIPTTNLEAYDNYLRGMYFYNNRFGQGDEFIFNAVRMFENAIELDSNFAFAHLRMAYSQDHIYFNNIDGSNERAELARYHYKKALELDPDDPEVREGQGWLEYHINFDLKAAREIFLSISNRYPKLASPLNALGVVNSRLGNWQEAEDNFERSILLDPNYLVTHLNFYLNLESQRKFARAKNYLDRMLNISPESLRANREMTNLIVLVSGDPIEAMRYYMESGMQDPHQQRLLSIYMRSYDKLIEEAPTVSESDDIATLSDYAMIYYHAGDMNNAQLYARAAISRILEYLDHAPNDFAVKSNLGLLYALIGESANAKKYSLEAITSRSIEKDALGGPEYLLTHAKCLTLLNEHQESIETLTQLLNIPAKITVNLLKVDPIWDSLRDRDDFASLLDLHDQQDAPL